MGDRRSPNGHGLPDLHRLHTSLDHDRLAAGQFEAVACQLSGEPADQDLARGGHLFEASRHVDGITQDGDGAVATELSDHHLTGVDADGKGQIAAQLGHSQSRRHGPLGIVVVGLGHAEQSHQAVAHVLVNGAAVGHDHLPHATKGSIDGAGQRFGIGVLSQAGEADDIGEQDRRQLAFARGRSRRVGASQRTAAATAESVVGRIGRTARRAGQALERRAALSAEPEAGPDLLPADCTRPH
jgi:hypothetical protein